MMLAQGPGVTPNKAHSKGFGPHHFWGKKKRKKHLPDAEKFDQRPSKED